MTVRWKMRCEVAGMFIPPLPVLLSAVVLVQLNWGLALLSVPIPLTEPPETMVSNAFRRRRMGYSQEPFMENVRGRRTIDTEREILICRGSC
jgi:hypothetical protein